MSTVEPKDARVSALRARILDAARRIVTRDGIDALSMRKIADAIGYSPASLYLHFEGRDAIARALGREGFAQLLARLQPCTEIEDTRARLHALAHAYVAFGCAHPQTYRLMFLPERGQCDEDQAQGPALEARPDHEAVAITRLFADAFAPVFAEPAPLARALWALLHGVVAFSLAGPAFAPESSGLLAIDAALDGWIGAGAAQKTRSDAT
ncbi:AcrR family transcriptional regulator [Paraburkholderia bannensis]|uniref:AcrR family transcriptional regulator n=1 Tax=Paraburkholderia bannensis TaxID=765414 RepID=A0A7W9WV98_9BURK|nr:MULTISPECIES: TetR/AcrR family transcriptional regulator [Paraburkholderia]MBB3259622.1 AcrR family transcriptional regulator [Paraburkholderia sp. WP4_3_2]MBB6104638.1 AcrR family transcriptional regulator [Paraburkholderia bannensis]